jgi:hypothetical protein
MSSPWWLRPITTGKNIGTGKQALSERREPYAGARKDSRHGRLQMGVQKVAAMMQMPGRCEEIFGNVVGLNRA